MRFLTLLAVLLSIPMMLPAALQGPPADQGSPPAQRSPERQRLRVDGPRFYDAGNRVWRWRGATQFLLFARFLKGEDITAQLDWLVAHGFNVVRVFGQVPAEFRAEAAGITDYQRPHEHPYFPRELGRFFDTLAMRGLRVEYVPLTYADALDVMRDHVQLVFDIAASRWNVFVEVANEPEHNGIDVVAVMKGVDRRGVLTAYGLDPARASREAWPSVPVLDYGTTHDLDRDLERSPTVTRSALDMQRTFNVPFVNDEPIGAIDAGHPEFRQTGAETWGALGGGGARTTRRDVFLAAAAIAYMYSAGYTYHFQAGLEARVPPPEQKVQNDVASGLRDLANFLPNETQLGKPVEAGDPDFGLAGPGYGVIVGNRQWVVVPRVNPTAAPTPRDGWRVQAVGPVPYVLELAK